MSHPIHLVKAVLEDAIVDNEADGLKLQVVAYPRDAKDALDLFLESSDEYKTLDIRRRATIDAPKPQTLEHQVQVAVFNSVCGLLHGGPAFIGSPAFIEAKDIEWGIAMDMGSHILPGVDMATGLGAVTGIVAWNDVRRRLRDVYASVAEVTVDEVPHLVFYKTGTSYHAYFLGLLPRTKRSQWYEALKELNAVDSKWCEIALEKSSPTDDQAVLRWSAGGNGRCVPMEWR